MKDHFESFAAYNRWANQRLFDAAAQLTDEHTVRIAKSRLIPCRAR